MVALVGAMKTALVSVHSVIARREGVDYISAVALTGVPLIISAISGMASTILARIYGKRPVYLVSTALMFIGCAWNTNTGGSTAQNMAARIFQGLGWGAFDTLVLGSILDTFFVWPLLPGLLYRRIFNLHSSRNTSGKLGSCYTTPCRLARHGARQ